MRRIIESLKLYKGREDLKKVKVGENLEDADSYGLSLLGKVSNMAKTKDDSLIYSFPYFTNPETRQYKDCYSCEGYYFFREEKELHELVELSDYFKVAAGIINFGGYLIHPQYGIRGLVGFGESLYMTNASNKYTYIGKKTEFLSDKYTSIFYTGESYIAIDDESKYHVAIVTYDSEMKPNFNIDSGEIPLSDAAQLINPVCGSTMVSLGKYANYYVNKSGSYAYINNMNNVPQYSFGKFKVDFDKIKKNFMQDYVYSIDNNDISLPYKVTKNQDGIQSYCESIYNEKRQIKETNESINGWNDNLTSIVKNMTKRTSYVYAWEKSEATYSNIAKTAIALLDNVEEKILDFTGNQVQYNEVSSSYTTRKDIDNTDRLIYLSSSCQDGITETSHVKVNEVLSYDQMGHTRLTGGVVYGGVTGAGFRLYSQAQYSSKEPDMLLATFDGVYYSDENEKCMSAYTGFEPYENVEYISGKIVTDGYILENAVLAGNSLWGSRTAYFPQGGVIKLSDNVYVNSLLNLKYVVCCVTRKDGYGNDWKIETTYINAGDLPQTRIIKNIPAGTYVEMILFKASDCESKIYLYNSDTYDLKGYIDNNFVPTIQMLDLITKKVEFSFQYLLEENEGNKIITDKLIVNPMCILGYAMLGGYSKLYSENLKKEKHNTILDIRCRENAQIVLPGNIYTLNSTSVLVMGRGRNTVEFGGLEDFVFEWTTDGITIYKNKAIYTVIESEFRIDSSANWIIGSKGEILFIILNGKLIYSTVVSNNPFFSVLVLDQKLSVNMPDKLICMQNFDLAVNYYDYLGRLVQTQTIKIMNDSLTRIISNMYFYNSSSQVVAYTLKGAYPIDNVTKITSDDRPLFFRENCAFINWNTKTETDPRGILTGELADYYRTGSGRDFLMTSDDYKYPYIYEQYEKNGTGRFLEEMSPGVSGNGNLEKKSYQSKDMFDTVFKLVTCLDANYDTNYNFVNIQEQNVGLLDTDVYDVNNDVLLKLHRTSNVIDDGISYKVKNGITSDEAITGSILGLGKTFYRSNLQNKLMKQLKTAFNRIQVQWSVDSGYKVLITDIAGNGRLVFNGGDINKDLCSYFKYDKRSRITEMGTVGFSNVTLQELLDFTMDPDYPYVGAIKTRNCKVVSQYEYDLENHGYSLGRLCKYVMSDSNYVHEYSYDQMGRICKQTALLNSNKTEQSIKKDYLSNIVQIEYQRNQDISLVFNYKYNDNNVKEIQYMKSALSHIVFTGAEYDIFNRLLKYTDCNGTINEIKYDFLGRQIMMKLTDKNQRIYSVEKLYTENNRKYERLEQVKYEPGGYVRKYIYDEYLRLKDVTDKENNLKYDLNGNLLEYDTGGSKKILQYMAGTNKLISADINTFVYNDFGCVTEKNGSSEELKIQYDTLFPAKITSIGKLSSSGVIESLYSFHYDIFANVVNMIYSLPEAQTAISYHYLYSEDGRLEQIEAVTAQERDYECYVYVGNRPIAMLGTGEKWYGLVYDDAETLYMETKENEIIQTKYNAWGVPEEYNEATKCLYKKMNYIPDLKLYSNNGALYDPTYGITYVPIVENEACTPYRIINNVPFI